MSSLEPFTYKTMHISSSSHHPATGITAPSSRIGRTFGQHNFDEGGDADTRSTSAHWTLSDLSSSPTTRNLISSSAEQYNVQNFPVPMSGPQEGGGGRGGEGNVKRGSFFYFEYVIDSLRRATKYSVIIQAFNSRGAGPSTNELTIETFSYGTFNTSTAL